jgi:hypothetical protein
LETSTKKISKPGDELELDLINTQFLVVKCSLHLQFITRIMNAMKVNFLCWKIVFELVLDVASWIRASYRFFSITQVTYSYLPLEKNNKASRLTNLFRNQGSSFRVTFANVVLARRVQFHTKYPRAASNPHFSRPVSNAHRGPIRRPPDRGVSRESIR